MLMTHAFQINGKLTIGENIADNGGIKQAFMAYQEYLKELGHEEPRLPGLVDLSNDQLFFMSFAQFWCGDKLPESLLLQVLSDAHTPEEFRVKGVMSNSHDFAKAFNCKSGSKMNPVRKCSVW